jgi:hypothetical protein
VKSTSLCRCLFLSLAVAGIGYLYGCGGSSHHRDAGDDGGGIISGNGGNVLNPELGGAPGGGGGAIGPGGGAPGQGGAGASTVVPCGEPGTQCCAGNGCNNGGCCVSGICMAVGGVCVGIGDGVCSAGACGTCGGLGAPCCKTSTNLVACTASGTKCVGNACAKCGDLGDPCCASNSGGVGTCNAPGAICSNDVCTVCGAPGTQCCPGNQCTSPGCCYNSTCVAEASACGATGGICQAGRCSGCGDKGEPCCVTSCYDGLLCKNGSCTSCGASGEICCPAGGSTPQCQTGNVCTQSGTDAICARCGALGDVCCTGSLCSEGCCSAGRCVASSGPCTVPDASVPHDAPPASGGGGAIGSGGIYGTGGIHGTGGIVGAGGIVGTGGRVGSGGLVGSGGVTSTGGCGALIDNMESGTGYICQAGGRYGMWFTYVDTYSTSTITPPAESTVLPALMSTPRASTSNYAMHVSGRYSTYAGMGVWLYYPSTASHPGTFDASPYTGIHFYAKGSGPLIVVGQMRSTESVDYGGTCTATTCTGNSYKVGSLSSSSWAEIIVPFTSLTGGTATPFSPAGIWSLEFQYYSSTSLAGASFDLWIDDLSFY